MNDHYLPPEILEKIIIEGNYFEVSKVNKKWRELSQKNKLKFKEIVFDLDKDEPKKIKKELDTIFIYNSQQYEYIYDIEKDFYYSLRPKYVDIIYQKFENIFKNFLILNKLTIIFNPLVCVDFEDIPKYILSKNNFNQKIFGIFIGFRIFLNIINYLKLSNIKIKIINIKIKDCYNKIKNLNANIFLENEIETLSRLIKYQYFNFFEKFTFNAPNNTYLIYDENKKILIIRFGNYEKYNLTIKKISICKECQYYYFCFNNNHKQYTINCFRNIYMDSDIHIYYLYPIKLFMNDYKKLLKDKIEKLIIISSEYYEFVFDQLLETSIQKKDKKIEYHCLESDKTKFEQENFSFVPVEKENEPEYSFDQIYFNFLKKTFFNKIYY